MKRTQQSDGRQQEQEQQHETMRNNTKQQYTADGNKKGRTVASR